MGKNGQETRYILNRLVDNLKMSYLILLRININYNSSILQCNDVQCIFANSGFLTDKDTLNKDAYRSHLRQWAENHKGWNMAVDKAIHDCVDSEPRQHLDIPCKAYDVFTCTGIAMLKVKYSI